MKRFLLILIGILALVNSARAQIYPIGGIGGSGGATATNIVNLVGTGTNDDLAITAAGAALPPNSTLALYGTFNLSQTIYWRTSNTKLDISHVSSPGIGVPGSWAAAGRSALQIGNNHVLVVTAISLQTVGGVANCLQAASTANGGFGGQNGDLMYLLNSASSATYPTGITQTTPLYIVNYTPTGFGNGTCNFSLTKGGAPIVCASAGTTTNWSLYLLTATFNSSTEVITFLGTPPTFTSGQSFIFTSNIGNSLPTGAKTFIQYYLSPTTGNSYTVYQDAGLNVKVTWSSNGNSTAYMGGCPAVSNVTIYGGRTGGFAVASGVPSSNFSVIKDNLGDLNCTIDGVLLNFAGVLASTDFDIYDGGTQLTVKNCSAAGGAYLVSGQSAPGLTMINNTVGGGVGLYTGTTSSNPPFTGIHIGPGNTTYNCTKQAINITSSSLGADVSGNSLNNDNTSAASPNAEIVNAGTATNIGANTFTLNSGTSNISNTGTAMLNPSAAGTYTAPTDTAPGSLVIDAGKYNSFILKYDTTTSGNIAGPVNGYDGEIINIVVTNSGTPGASTIQFNNSNAYNTPPILPQDNGTYMATFKDVVGIGGSTTWQPVAFTALNSNWGIGTGQLGSYGDSETQNGLTGAQSAICTVVPSAAGTYEIGGVVNFASGATDVINVNVTYDDENGHAQSKTLPVVGTLSPSCLAGSNLQYPLTILPIRVGTGANIVVNTVLATGGGTANYDVSAFVRQSNQPNN